MRRKQKIYRALTLLWHTADGRYVAPGEAVSLEHLNDEEIATLIAMNAIEEVKRCRRRPVRSA